MPIDKISEIISHFIGTFAITDGEGRLREQTDGFRHTADGDIPFEGHDTATLLLRAAYEAVGHDPGLTPFMFSALAPGWLQDAGMSAISNLPTVVFRLAAPDPVHAGLLRIHAPHADSAFSLVPPPPSAIAVVSHQINIMSDNDIMLSGGNADFVDLAAFDAKLGELVSVADTLTPAAMGNPLTALLDAPAYFATIAADYAGRGETAPQDATATTLSGNAVLGTTINGVAADAAPDFIALLPQYFQDDDTQSDPDDAPPPFTDIDGSAHTAAALFDVEDGHFVNAGGNLIANEVAIVSQPVDAAVIAVMGDVVSLAAISQVNVQRDVGSGHNAPVSPTQAINAATVALRSSVNDAAMAEPTDVLPEIWGVTRIEADLITVNWLHQYNFVTDNDCAQITFSGEDSYLDFGGNTALNQVSLLEFCQGYDLIIVGGQMINMALITQTNVLLDDDHVTYDGDWPATVSIGDNLIFNNANIDFTGVDTYTAMTDAFANAGNALANGGTTLDAAVAQDALFAGHEYLSVLYIAGDLINVTSIEQTNILGDADQIGVELAALEDRPDEPDGPLTITTGSNAVVNLATIMEYGMDSTVLVGGEVYDDLLLYQASFIDPDADPIGVATVPLANEAVAFLADDMMTDSGTADTTFIAPTDDAGASPDVMQTVLA